MKCSTSWMGDALSIKEFAAVAAIVKQNLPSHGLTLALIREAHARIKDKINRTPVRRAPRLMRRRALTSSSNARTSRRWAPQGTRSDQCGFSADR